MEVENCKTKRTTFRLPPWLHKAIRTESHDLERDMTEIIIEQMALRYKDLPEARLFFGSVKEAKVYKNTEAMQEAA